MAATSPSSLTPERWNTLLARGQARAQLLAPEVVAVMTRVLTQAGEDAADRFIQAQETATVAAGTKTWNIPDADTLVNLDELGVALAKANRKLRERIVAAALGDIKGEFSINFDLRNPIIDNVLLQAGQNIVNVSASQRQTIMRALNKAWRDGSSIPQAAALIRSRSAGVAASRAQTIARTEIVGIANGGSLAAARITGTMKQKVWLVSPGAPHPRHGEYDGLDGQARGLSEPFEVGGFAMDYPGDPNGPAAETCNCRCTVIYQ